MHFTHTLSIFITVIALASAAPNCGIPCNPITECTSTSTTVASCFNGGPTATVYDATVTVTSSVNCAGCEILDITTRYRPCPLYIIEPTTTITTTSTDSVFVCSPTPEPL